VPQKVCIKLTVRYVCVDTWSRHKVYNKRGQTVAMTVVFIDFCCVWWARMIIVDGTLCRLSLWWLYEHLQIMSLQSLLCAIADILDGSRWLVAAW